MQASQLLDITKDAFLDQVVSAPTRITENTRNILDLFFTNNTTLVNKCEVIPGISDHEAVFIESSLRPMRVKVPARKVFKYRKANFGVISDELASHYNTFKESARESNVNEIWKTFETKLKQLMEKHIPSKMLSGNKINKPWINKDLKSHIRRRNKLYAKGVTQSRRQDQIP